MARNGVVRVSVLAVVLATILSFLMYKQYSMLSRMERQLITFQEEERRLARVRLESQHAEPVATPQFVQPVEAPHAQAVPVATPAASFPESKASSAGLYELEIFVFTYNRLEGLQRLWSSLFAADYRGQRVDITICFDKMERAEERDGTAEWIEMHATWPHGSFRVLKRTHNVGLRANIMEAWYPVRPNSFAAFFEDDIEVSPYWFHWVDNALRKYYFGSSSPPERMVGISLYRPIHDELTEKSMVIENGHKPFLLQQPCSWGAVYFPAAWRYFREWMTVQTSDPRITDFWLASNTWHADSSWKKYLIKLMYSKGLFMIYPNLPDKRVLATNHLMKGAHPLPKRELFYLPLLSHDAVQKYEKENKGLTKLLDCPSLQTLQVFDLRVKRVSSIQELPHSRDPFRASPFAPRD
eukprot:TRINITY_DN14940_c0_g1_i1.p1 TRINITY_DN14940_c0_g1~~TRINITY_DN14940_c0_g1_i1.p1  ORF type:complete len:411 (+),score=43.07 TRINITY_DN14940_c0_g1_i1:25-1257(+)